MKDCCNRRGVRGGASPLIGYCFFLFFNHVIWIIVRYCEIYINVAGVCKGLLDENKKILESHNRNKEIRQFKYLFQVFFKGNSSVGRTVVFKTKGQGFKSLFSWNNMSL